jgi:hypothetical protein
MGKTRRWRRPFYDQLWRMLWASAPFPPFRRCNRGGARGSTALIPFHVSFRSGHYECVGGQHPSWASEATGWLLGLASPPKGVPWSSQPPPVCPLAPSPPQHLPPTSFFSVAFMLLEPYKQWQIAKSSCCTYPVWYCERISRPQKYLIYSNMRFVDGFPFFMTDGQLCLLVWCLAGPAILSDGPRATFDKF